MARAPAVFAVLAAAAVLAFASTAAAYVRPVARPVRLMPCPGATYTAEFGFRR